MQSTHHYSRLFRIVPMVLGMLLLLYTASLIEVYRYSLISSDGPADAVIVPGAVVWGRTPSPVFVERINHAIQLYRSGRVQYLILTGGKSHGDRLSEADAAKVYAMGKGIDAQYLLTESSSTSSYENLLEARRIIEQRGLKRVLIASDPLHMKRLMSIAGDLGIDAQPSPTPTSKYRSLNNIVPFLLREGLYYALYTLLPLHSGTLGLHGHP